MRTRTPDATERHGRGAANSGTDERTVVYITRAIIINVLYPSRRAEEEFTTNDLKRIHSAIILSFQRYISHGNNSNLQLLLD